MSARNCYKGVIESVEDGVVTSKVRIRIEKPTIITAVITKEAVKDLQLKRGDEAYAIIKSTCVMVAKD